MYKITLMDDTSVSCTSFTVSVFCEELEQFEKEWTKLETDQDRIERFRRSKAGEVVTDFYKTNNDAALNIVQQDPGAEVVQELTVEESDKEYTVLNAYGWPSKLYVDHAFFHIRYVRFQNAFLKLSSYRLTGICKSGFDEGTYTDVTCWGNKFLNSETCGERMAKSKDVFKQDRVESFVFYEIGRFDSMEDLQADFKQMKEHGLTERELDCLLKDIPGEAG